MTWEVVVEPCPTTPGFLAAESETLCTTQYVVTGGGHGLRGVWPLRHNPGILSKNGRSACNFTLQIRSRSDFSQLEFPLYTLT